jgi:hypothetical protein
VSIVRASVIGTAVFAAAALAGVVKPDPLDRVALIVSLLLFLAGCVLFFWGYAIAVTRSRTDEISVAGLFFLAGGSAPRDVQRVLLASSVAEVVIAFAAAAARPFSPLAFAILAPLYGLACTGLWAARHGTFPPRIKPARRR